MKAILTSLLLLFFGLLSGCNSVGPKCCHETPSYIDTDYPASTEIYTNCCDQPDLHAQSGYYYNGYQENGWRFCIARPVEFINY